MATFLSPTFQLVWYKLVGEVTEPAATTVAEADYHRRAAVRRMIYQMLLRHIHKDADCQRVLDKVLELRELAPADMPWHFSQEDLRGIVASVVKELRA